MPTKAQRSTAKKSTTKRPAPPRFPPSPKELVARFDQVLQGRTGVERKVVFGYACGFVNGYMTFGLHADAFFVRLPAEDQAALLKLKGAGHLEVMTGRPMTDYVVLPTAVVSKPTDLRRWVDLAVDRARSLPPKASGRSR